MNPDNRIPRSMSRNISRGSTMSRQEIYKISANKNGRRILIVNNLLEVDKCEEIKREDFDAIFINIAHRAYEENRLITRWTSPIRSSKCFLKPRFATSSLEEFMHFAAYLIDGFCMTPFDDAFADFIENIYTNIEKFNINAIYETGNNTTPKFLSDIIKYDISRGRNCFMNSTIRGMTEGYTSAYLAWYDNQETLQYEERMKFNFKLEELEFAVKNRFVEKVHVCPNCGHSHLLFVETCPKCDSSNIHQESIIHHFRCANVSPESTYEHDGQLVCPKCKKELRHIGVDYDRPASMYYCNECGNSFLQSKMRVICSNCRAETSPDKLKVIDVWEYRLTRQGIEAFCNNSALIQIENKDIFSGHSTYFEFINAINSYYILPSYSEFAMNVLRFRIESKGEHDSRWRFFDLIRAINAKIAIVKTAQKDDFLYVMAISRLEKSEEEFGLIEKNLIQLFKEYETDDKTHLIAELISKHYLTQEDNLEAFIAEIEKHYDDFHDGKNETV